MRERIAVSACLLGVNCKYNGGHNLNQKVIDYINGKEVVMICPEVFGGLGTPRIPCEIQSDGRVINREGLDVSENFRTGKEKTFELLEQNRCKRVILKDGSPSCGYKTVYDGTFSNRKTKGLGVTAKYLLEKGIEIVDLDT
mgnify:CR=1 FL=1